MHRNQNATSNTPADNASIGLQWQHVRLPTFELPDFNGTVDSFPEFWDLYCAAIHNNTSLFPVHKFLYLKSYLKGNAASIISNFQPTAENYEEAVRIILNTYNRPEVLRNKLWDKLVATPKASASVTSQRVTLCGIKAICAQMQKLSEHPGATGTMKVIRSKFPDRTREKGGELRRKCDPSWTVDDLLRALDTVIEQLELIEDTDPKDNLSFSALSVQHEPRSRGSCRYYMKRSTSPQSFCSSTPRGLHNEQKVRCNFCLRQGHVAEDCRELRNPRERRKVCIAFKLCWRCFSTRHRSQECSKPRCHLCDGDHHRLLCYHVSSLSHSVERAQSPSQSRSPFRCDARSRPHGKFNFTDDSRERSCPSDSTSSSEDMSRSRDNSMRRSNSPHPKARVTFTDPHNGHAACVVNASTCITSFDDPNHSDDESDCVGEDFTSPNYD
ncbi:hypothetical protein Y032_0019g3748 [Ancylostoma ceylanicum]|uniref:CCHC-type domain-containing protein n=1 Tax=Ancylostoma ceylanicum TaxID=53326 RepID=A0A016V1G6_9BILA|nr:hypothetical protein Y032_0019g3748 [Ancylostoma ceylanicum]